MCSSVGSQAQQHRREVRLHTEDFGLWLGSDGGHRPADDAVCGDALLQSTWGYSGHGLPGQWLVIIYVLLLFSFHCIKVFLCPICYNPHSGIWDIFCFNTVLAASVWWEFIVRKCSLTGLLCVTNLLLCVPLTSYWLWLPCSTKLVDIWSVGCILAEMVRHKILFPGRDCILGTLKYLQSVCAVPAELDWI